MRFVSGASAALRRRAGSRSGLMGMFAWGFAEALVWPIIPDAGLALLVLSRPRRWFALSMSAVAGSVAGGITGVLAAAQGLRWPLPLTTPRMVTSVQGWLAAGPDGLSHQPLSGVPYKVFVVEAPDAGIGAWELAFATLHYRAPRLIAVAAITGVVAAVGWRCIAPRQHALVHVGVTVVATAGLLAGLAAVVARWS